MLSSLFADDPDLTALVHSFVDELPARLATIRSAREDGERDRYVRLVHQLAGAGGSYGFGELSSAASTLELVIRRAAGPAAEYESLQVLERTIQSILADYQSVAL
jgi:HPt (histidine-containing phosphotransfer) domain-containing protein